MASPLEKLRDIVDTLPRPLKHMCSEVVENLLFQKSPGGSTRHHAYEGGLLDHTLEVVELVSSMADSGSSDSFHLLVTAAIFHDFCKTLEYEIAEDGSVTNLPYRKLIGHVVGSYVHFLTLADKHDLGVERKNAIGHCMLAHHGRLEWRSPVEPQTKEAYILHSADMISMQRGSKHD